MTQNKKERLAEIARRVQEKREQEELAEIEAYEGLLNSTKWTIFKWASYATALLAILMTIDILIPGKKVDMERYELVITHGYIVVDEVWYTPPILENGGGLQGFQRNSFNCERSIIFDEVKRVCWTSEVWQYDDDAEPIYEERCAPSWNTIYYYFPGPSIAFMIPLMVVGFKRMSPWFTFFRYASWIVIFPCAILLATLLIM